MFHLHKTKHERLLFAPQYLKDLHGSKFANSFFCLSGSKMTLKYIQEFSIICVFKNVWHNIDFKLITELYPTFHENLKPWNT